MNLTGSEHRYFKSLWSNPSTLKTAPPETYLGHSKIGVLIHKTIVLPVVGYLRPELPFEGLEKLTTAIKQDIADSERLAWQSDSTTLAERDWVETSLGNESLDMQ